MTALQILIPMAGRGQRFKDAGYDQPKPFIEVDGFPMWRRVLANLPSADRTTLLVLEEHFGRLVAEDDRIGILRVGAVTDGAACTVLLCEGEDLIDGTEPLLIANADQWLDWSPEHCADFVKRDGCDGAIVTFRASGPKWSYADVREDGTVACVAEKVPISDSATCGVYYWKRAGDCFASIRRMMEKGLRVGGEYYLAPSFNEMILDGARIVAYPVPRMWGLGTPDDLKRALEAKPWRST